MARSGIGGIERKIKQQNQETDKNISEAFQDLSRLMANAKEMSSLSKSIAQRLQDRSGQSALGDDETVKFKSQLLSLGLSDALAEESLVTRKEYANQSEYFRQLGKQVASIIRKIAQDAGGQMSLTDVFCTVNRARGLELVSPEDILNACATLEKQRLSLKLVKYESGLITVECDNYNQNEMNDQTLAVISGYVGTLSGPGLTAHQLSVHCGIPLALARQRLLSCESAGLAVRDAAIQGLAFFPNRFLDGA